MSFRVSGKNLDLGEALRDRISDRIAEIVGKYFDGGYSGHVTLAKDGFGFRTECAIHLDSKITLQAEGMAPDAYASADQAALRIEKRLRRYHRRLEGSPRRTRRQPRRGRCCKLYHRRPGSRRQRRWRGLHAGHHRRIDDDAETAFGQRRGDGTGHDRRSGPGVPACRTRRRQYRLSPRRRAFRLDRSAGFCRRQMPIDAVAGGSLWSAAFEHDPAKPAPDAIQAGLRL